MRRHRTKLDWIRGWGCRWIPPMGRCRNGSSKRTRRRSRWLLLWVAVGAVGAAVRWLGLPVASVRR